MANAPYFIFTFIVGDNTVTVAKNSVYRLVAWSGVESVENVVAIENNVSIDGGYIGGEHIPARRISVTFAIDDKKQTENLRKYLIGVFNPKKNGTLIVERGGKKGKIDFKIENAVTYQQANIREERLHITVNIICPDPYFRDAEDNTNTFLLFAPMMYFPLGFVGDAGMITGVPLTTDDFIINNIGDVPIGIVANLNVYSGTVVNPQISCNDEFVRVIVTLSSGDIMQIDTRPGKKNIYINGGSYFQWDNGSRFFQIEPGESVIRISADSGISNVRASIVYANKWFGV